MILTGGASSWAAAAGKNLPPQGANPGPGAGSSASSKQQLEQLSTMREALYSQVSDLGIQLERIFQQ